MFDGKLKRIDIKASKIGQGISCVTMTKIGYVSSFQHSPFACNMATKAFHAILYQPTQKKRAKTKVKPKLSPCWIVGLCSASASRIGSYASPMLGQRQAQVEAMWPMLLSPILQQNLSAFTNVQKAF